MSCNCGNFQEIKLDGNINNNINLYLFLLCARHCFMCFVSICLLPPNNSNCSHVALEETDTERSSNVSSVV